MSCLSAKGNIHALNAEAQANTLTAIGSVTVTSASAKSAVLKVSATAHVIAAKGGVPNIKAKASVGVCVARGKGRSLLTATGKAASLKGYGTARRIHTFKGNASVSVATGNGSTLNTFGYVSTLSAGGTVQKPLDSYGSIICPIDLPTYYMANGYVDENAYFSETGAIREKIK